MNRVQLIATILTTAFVLQTTSASAQERLKNYLPPGFHLGGVVHGDSEGFKSLQYRNVAQLEFNSVTSTVYLPWGGWKSFSTPPDTSYFANVVDWATRHGLKVHGHVLVYPDANLKSKWWQQQADHLVAPRMKTYIDKMAGVRRGKIWVWDVLNEIMANKGQAMDANGLRTDFKEYRAMGPEYVNKAFEWAKAADPNAKLIINDFDISSWNSKSTRLLNYAIKLKNSGVPINGIGFQMHFVDVNSPAPNLASIRKNFQRFADAGFELYITEFDTCSLRTKNPHPGSPGVSTPNDQQLERQKRFFKSVLKIALEQPAVKSFLMWDYADDFSWLHKTDQQIHNVSPGTYTYPAPFWCGKHCPIKRKPAYFGMLEALKTTPRIKH